MRTSMSLAYRDSKCTNLSVYCPYQDIVCFVLDNKLMDESNYRLARYSSTKIGECMC